MDVSLGIAAGSRAHHAAWEREFEAGAERAEVVIGHEPEHCHERRGDEGGGVDNFDDIADASGVCGFGGEDIGNDARIGAASERRLDDGSDLRVGVEFVGERGDRFIE